MSVLDGQISRRQVLQAERCGPSRHVARPSGAGASMLHARTDSQRHHQLISSAFEPPVSVGYPIGVASQIPLGSAPDSWGVWFPHDPQQTSWERFLDELAGAGYEWLELVEVPADGPG